MMSKEKKKMSYKDNARKRGEEASIVRRVVAIIILLLIIIIGAGGYAGYNYIKSALEPVDPSDTEVINVNIPMGSSSSTIANILKEHDLIKDARVFRFYVKFRNEGDFQAGDYELTKADSFDEIIEALKSGKVEDTVYYTVAIPEGKNIEEIAEIYANKLPFTQEEFLEVVEDEEYVKELMAQYPTILTDAILEDDIRTPLEGYLFAATYQIYEEEPEVEAIVEMMLDKTEEVVSKYLSVIEEREWTVHEALTFASLLEKEARSEDERKNIASVFYNRLDDGMKLQTDPTVLYALGEHKDRVLYSDLEIESPYNTYYIEGLPVGPISNFGENSLEATLEPAETNYFYFLHDFDGNIHYAETHDEHIRLRNEYRSDDNS